MKRAHVKLSTLTHWPRLEYWTGISGFDSVEIYVRKCAKQNNAEHEEMFAKDSSYCTK